MQQFEVKASDILNSEYSERFSALMKFRPTAPASCTARPCAACRGRPARAAAGPDDGGHLSRAARRDRARQLAGAAPAHFADALRKLWLAWKPGWAAAADWSAGWRGEGRGHRRGLGRPGRRRGAARGRRQGHCLRSRPHARRTRAARLPRRIRHAAGQRPAPAVRRLPPHAGADAARRPQPRRPADAPPAAAGQPGRPLPPVGPACRRPHLAVAVLERARPVLVRPPGHAAPDARTQGHVLGAAARMDRAAAAAPLRAIRHPDPPAMGSALPGRAEHAHRPGQRRALCARAARQPGRQARSQRPAAALHRLVGVVAGRRRAA